MPLQSLHNSWPPYLEDVVVFVGRKRASKVISAKKADSQPLLFRAAQAVQWLGNIAGKYTFGLAENMATKTSGLVLHQHISVITYLISQALAMQKYEPTLAYSNDHGELVGLAANVSDCRRLASGVRLAVGVTPSVSCAPR